MTKREFDEALSGARAQGVTDAETYQLEDELAERVDSEVPWPTGLSRDAADIAAKLDGASLTDPLAVLSAVEGAYQPVGCPPLAFGGLK